MFSIGKNKNHDGDMKKCLYAKLHKHLHLLLHNFFSGKCFFYLFTEKGEIYHYKLI